MEKLWTTAEVARYLGVSEAEVEQLARDGRLTGYKLGGRFLRFRPDQVHTLKETLAPRAQEAVVAPAESRSWQERLRDFVYFYDFYIVSFILLAGLVVYLLSSR